MEVSEICQIYFNVGWKELTELMNCSIPSPVDEVAPTQSSM